VTAEALPAPNAHRVAYRIDEVAAMTGKKPRALRALYEKGIIPGKRLGREILVPADFVAQFGPLPAGGQS
jgi:hypothetical protein